MTPLWLACAPGPTPDSPHDSSDSVRLESPVESPPDSDVHSGDDSDSPVHTGHSDSVPVDTGPFFPVLEGDLEIEDVGYELLGADIGDQAGRIVGHWDTDDDGVVELLIGAPYAGDDRGRVHIASTPIQGQVQLTHEEEILGRDTAGNFGGQLDVYEGHLVVGASEDDLCDARSGAVFFLAPTAVHADDAWLGVCGDRSGDHLGRAVRIADVDGDEVLDLLVGANGVDLDGDLENAGAAYVIPGPLTASTELDDASATLLGTTRSAWMGSAVTSGDLDGDGLPEWIASAYATDFEDCEDCGLVAIAPGDLEGQVPATDVPHMVGAFTWTGRSLGPPADLTGDGLDDLMIAAPASSEVRFQGGTVYVYDSGYDDDLDPDDAWATLQSTNPDRYLGDSMHPWDQDGDGTLGLAIGVPYHNAGDEGVLTSAGAVYLFHQLEPGVHDMDDADARLSGTTAFRQLGRSMDVIPDATGDGAPDLLIGMFHDPEQAQRTGAFLVPGAHLE